MKSVNKVLDRAEKEGIFTESVSDSNAKENFEEFSVTSTYVKESGKVIRVDLDEIIAIEGLKDYVKIITDENQ
jgi:DNA-binding LytR/AlgR family response regulator